MKRNYSQNGGISPEAPALAKLANVQKQAPKNGSIEWWARPYLSKTAKLPKHQFEDALRAIHEKQVSDWYYKSIGREAAYCLKRFIPQLPERFRPNEDESVSLTQDALRQHVLDTVDMAERKFHEAVATEAHLPSGYAPSAIRISVRPYYNLVLDLARSGQLKLPLALIPVDEPGFKSYQKSDTLMETIRRANEGKKAEDMLEFLLRVRAWLVTKPKDES